MPAGTITLFVIVTILVWGISRNFLLSVLVGFIAVGVKYFFENTSLGGGYYTGNSVRQSGFVDNASNEENVSNEEEDYHNWLGKDINNRR